MDDKEKSCEIIKDIPQHPYHILNDDTIEGFTTIDLDECLMKMAEWKETHPSKEMINKICQLFMEHEVIESYNSDVINWIYEQFN